MEFGTIVQVQLKTVWPGVETDFTPWLSKNLDILSDKLGMELDLVGVEHAVGDFSADIVAKDVATNRVVVIENQYGSTDHRHLGQLLTYASNLGAGAVVWIAEAVRSEHKAAIDFLNLNLTSGLQLYAVEVKLIKIDGSHPAYIFNPVCLPREASPVGATGGEITEIQRKYRDFFQGLIDELRTVHHFTNAKVGQPQNWYAFTSENSRIFIYDVTFALGGRVRAEVYIDCGNKMRNEALFDLLYADLKVIEDEFGENLSWERLDNRRACRIAVYRDGRIDEPTETLEEIKKWSIAKLLKFKPN